MYVRTHPSEWYGPGPFCLLWGGNPFRAFTAASGHVTTVHVLPQFYSLKKKKKKKGFPDRWVSISRRCVFIHFTKPGLRACAGEGRSEMPGMRLRLHDETPHRSGRKSSAGEMTVDLRSALNSPLFVLFSLFLKWSACCFLVESSLTGRRACVLWPGHVRLFWFRIHHGSPPLQPPDWWS